MNKKRKKIIASLLISSMFCSNVAFATTASKINKNETVYVIKENDSIKDKIVSIWLNSDEHIDIKDNTNLEEIKNLKTGETLNKEDGYIRINENSKDVYYQGKTNKELPVDVKLDFYLDGEKTTNKELEGKTGKLKIVVSAENKQSVIKNISGKQTKIYSPYLVVGTMAFNEDNVKNIVAKNSKVIKDGKKEIVTTVLTPGLKENFENILSEDKMENFKDTVEIEMDITKYKPIETYVVISNEIFQNRKNLEEIKNLRSEMWKLENATMQLVDGSKKLNDAQGEINKGISDVADGMQKINEGSAELYNKSGLLEAEVNKSVNKLSEIPKYANELANGASRLNGGLGEVKKATNQISKSLSKLNLKTLFIKFEEMKKGISQIAQGSANLNSGISKVNKNVLVLAQGNDTFNAKMQEMNTGVQNITIPDFSVLKTINVEPDLRNIATATNAMGQSVADIQNTITMLSDEKYKDDVNIQNTIKTLEKTKLNLVRNSGTIGTSAGNLKNSLKPLKNVQSSAKQLNKITELQEGMSKLAETSNNINMNMQKLPQGLTKLEEGSMNLNTGINKIDREIDNINIDQDQINKLLEFPNQFVKLDYAIGELKTGSNDLSEGLNKFKNETKDLNEISKLSTEGIIPLRNGIKIINNGINDLSLGTTKLKDGSNKFNNSIGIFSSKMDEYKRYGIDKLYNKTSELFELTDVFDAMLNLATNETSFTGSDDKFKTRFRIVEKIQ